MRKLTAHSPQLAALLFSCILSAASCQLAFADKVITKDGKVYEGKILIDTDKSVLIGNPPFDPNSTLIKGEDIQTIVYEEYRQSPPAQRRRGLAINLHVSGNAYSSKENSLSPAAGLDLEGGFRFHPLFELGAGLLWTPALSVHNSELTITSSGSTPQSRSYSDFWQYTFSMTGKFYPFYRQRTWKTEPYILTGYGWSHLMPKNSGDSFEGEGWLLGVGAIHPITKHLFLDGRFTYHGLSYDTIHFLGQQGTLSPDIAQHTYSLSLGLSYRI